EHPVRAGLALPHLAPDAGRARQQRRAREPAGGARAPRPPGGIMKRGRLLQPDEIHLNQQVVVVPSGDDISRGHGLGTYDQDGSAARLTETLHSACRRGAVHLYELPEEEPEPPAPAPESQPEPPPPPPAETPQPEEP